MKKSTPDMRLQNMRKPEQNKMEKLSNKLGKQNEFITSQSKMKSFLTKLPIKISDYLDNIKNGNKSDFYEQDGSLKPSFDFLSDTAKDTLNMQIKSISDLRNSLKGHREALFKIVSTSKESTPSKETQTGVSKGKNNASSNNPKKAEQETVSKKPTVFVKNTNTNKNGSKPTVFVKNTNTNKNGSKPTEKAKNIKKM